MPEKLGSLEFDIVSLLQKNEPEMLRWSEIVNALWETFKFKYKDEKGFGIAVTYKLNILVAGHKIKKVDSYYGTNSSTLVEHSKDETEYPSTPENWNSLLSVFSKAGANLVDIEVEKPDDTKSAIKGIIVFRGSKKLQEIIKMHIPEEFEAYLLTEASLEKNDVVTWQEKSFIVKEVEGIYDIYKISYRIAKLAKPVYLPGPAWVFG